MEVLAPRAASPEALSAEGARSREPRTPAAQSAEDARRDAFSRRLEAAEDGEAEASAQEPPAEAGEGGEAVSQEPPPAEAPPSSRQARPAAAAVPDVAPPATAELAAAALVATAAGPAIDPSASSTPVPATPLGAEAPQVQPGPAPAGSAPSARPEAAPPAEAEAESPTLPVQSAKEPPAAPAARETAPSLPPGESARNPAPRLEAPARAAEPAPAPPPAEPLAPRAAEILRQIRLHLSPHLRQATLRLEPEALGRIEVRIAIRGGRASADLRVESEATLAVLQRHVPELRAALEPTGAGGGEVTLSWQEPRRQHDSHPAPAPRAPRDGGEREVPAARLAELARAAADAAGVDTYA